LSRAVRLATIFHAGRVGGLRGDVVIDEATPVTDAYEEGDNRFTGKIHKVTVKVG
jgi:hypothetical protein